MSIPRESNTLADRLRSWQQNDGANPLLHGTLSLTQLLLMAMAVACYHHGLYASLVLVWIAAVVVTHNKLIVFHEAAHGLQNPVRWINELIGHVIGMASLVPLTAYRIVHARHHAFLGTERDVEFWPFVDLRVPRWQRVLAVIGELFVGNLYDPLITLRGVICARGVPRAQRMRAWREYMACGLLWGTAMFVLTKYGWWAEACVGFFIPAYFAACLNSWRRMIEHLGMFGSTVETMTRTIVPTGRAGAVLSAAILNIEFHAAHHRYGKIPYYRLPEATRELYPDSLEQLVVFPSYRLALLDMLPHLADPRIGPQWNFDSVTGAPRRGNAVHS